MSISIFILLSAAGILSGFFGSIVGASLTVLVPLLVFLDLDIYTALGTGTAACFARGLTSNRNYLRAKTIDFKFAAGFSLPYLLATILGSYYALSIKPDSLKQIIFASILLVASLIILNPNLGTQKGMFNISGFWSKIIIIAGGSFTGFYNGIFGGGVTIFIIFILIAIFSFDFLHAAATTAFLALLGDLACSIIFALNSKVNFLYAAPLAAGMLIGGDLGSRSAINKGNSFIRVVFAVVVFALAIKLLTSSI